MQVTTNLAAHAPPPPQCVCAPQYGHRPKITHEFYRRDNAFLVQWAKVFQAAAAVLSCRKGTMFRQYTAAFVATAGLAACMVQQIVHVRAARISSFLAGYSLTSYTLTLSDKGHA